MNENPTTSTPTSFADQVRARYGSTRRFAQLAGLNYTHVYRSIFPERFPKVQPKYSLEELAGHVQRTEPGPVPGVDLTPAIRTALREAFDAKYERYTDLEAAHPKLRASWLSCFFLQTTATDRITPKVRALARVLEVSLEPAPATT